MVVAECAAATAGARAPKEYMEKCVAGSHTWSISFKHEMASFMGVSVARMPALFCERIFAGVSQGRINYSDINRLQSNRSTEIWKVLKGK